ncbi:hypothetical protein SCHPADRAFT_935149 [Schizopora paradoxa]|uniref:DUF6593 domain-containing protein n=1 Tax=Schizopora paradoxa TaxID=27342 RepID=A0A0H2S5W5_9AGAM|nr:hypothetical protein SCHPADRAFT_935149 [Schizopora paradoxa]
MSHPTSLFDYERGFESQVTLVDSGVHDAPYTFVSFLRDDMKNTKIVSSTEAVLYTVTTDALTNTRTTVYRGNASTEAGSEAVKVAEIKRKDLREDRIKLEGNTSSLKLSNWLHGASGKWTDFPVSFEWQNKTYIWKTNSARQIALYDTINETSQIAWFQTSRKGIFEGRAALFRAMLFLQKEGQEILDAVIVSLLIVEQRLRWREMKYQNAVPIGVIPSIINLSS